MAMTGDDDDIAKARAQAALSIYDDLPGPGEVWEHYEGGYYTIVAVSVMEDSLRHLVTYRSNAMGKTTTWTRSLEDWYAWVDPATGEPAVLAAGPPTRVRRFTRVFEF